MLTPVPVKVGGAVKLLPTEEALVHVDVAMQNGMAVEVVGPVETLTTHLAKEPLVVRVGVGEQVTLEQVLPVEPQSTYHAGDGHLLVLTCLGGGRCVHPTKTTAQLRRLERSETSLYEGEPLPVQRIPVEDSTHERAAGNTEGQLHHVVVFAGINWSLQLQEVLRLREVNVGDGDRPSPPLARDDGLLRVVVVGRYHDGRLRGIYYQGEEHGLAGREPGGTSTTVDH